MEKIYESSQWFGPSNAEIELRAAIISNLMESDDVQAYSRNRKEQWTAFLLVGCLSMLYAELFSGASRLWFVDVWSVLVTFPLYMVHVLFFFNAALRTKRSSLVHLYLWGTLFGMYESWITQVLWVGYTAQDSVIRTFFGIGIGEFLALVFFWHPVLSFVLPLIIFQLLALSGSSETANKVLPSHMPFLVKTKTSMGYLVVLYVVGSVFMAANYQGDIFLVLTVLGGTYGLIYLLFRKARSYNFSVYSLRVGNLGMKIIVIYLILLYAVMFFGYGYGHGRIPGPLPVITTLILYGIFILVVMSSHPSEESLEIPPALIAKRMKLSDYKHMVYFNFLLASAVCIVYIFVPFLVRVVVVFFYIAICVIGVYIFCKGISLRNKQTLEFLQSRYRSLNN